MSVHRADKERSVIPLDHVTLVYGAGMSESNSHDPHNLPILLVGGSAGQLKGGRHIRYPEATPLANLHLTVLDKLQKKMPLTKNAGSIRTFYRLRNCKETDKNGPRLGEASGRGKFNEWHT